MKLAGPKQFLRLIEAIENSGSGRAEQCADMVQLLADGGFRLPEAKNITWGDVDLTKGEILERG